MKLSVLAALVLAGPAFADDYVSFQSPTGNIHCAIFQDREGAVARCDLRELVPSFTRAPADCEFDWGSAFGVEDRGKGYLACVSDAVADRGNPVLPYG
ncbi:DUF6636 domain-containing protein [Tabrizicola aquatica]|uniref:DUF6636 domain-containing protein n=1 Tax=Tabrizicola aquatica TaxID=909926 RepID=UPI000CD30BA0|nr:DUF6636 domain-containing protein [Tabrizicola aquatica]